jgi:hypothetical protein
MDNLDFRKIRKLIDENPQILEKPKVGRKAGGRNQPVSIIATVEAEPEVEEISYSRAKQLGIKLRKPKQMTEEQKAKMLENLEKGREKLREINMQKRKVREEESKKPKIKEVNMVLDPKKTVKKYIIRPRKKTVKKKEQPHEEEEIESSSESESETDIPSGTDVEEAKVKKRVERKIKAVREIDDKISSLTFNNNMLKSKYGNLF